MRPLYRVRQLSKAINPVLDEPEHNAVDRILKPDEKTLFYNMSPALQKHSLNVFSFLVSKEEKDESLLAGALLHDIGKGKMGLLCRVLVVLLETFWPRGIEVLSSKDASNWRFGLYSHLRHPELGAEMAQRVGSSPHVVTIIRDHHRKDAQDSFVRLLQMADEAN